MAQSTYVATPGLVNKIRTLREFNVLIGARQTCGAETEGTSPTDYLSVTAEATCDCVKCDACGAARALQTGDINCRLLASVDANLLSVVLAWANLSQPIRKAIIGLAMS